MRPRRLIALLLIGGLGCRGVLGIDEDRKLLAADGGEVDAGDTADADAGADAGAGFCDSLAPKPAFCADFDQGDVNQGWENEGKVPNPGEFGGGKIELDREVARSTPASAGFSLPALVTSSGRAAAFLLSKYTTVPSAIRVDFDVFIATEYLPKATGGNVVVASVRFVPNCSVEIVRDSVGAAMAVYVGAVGTRTSVTALSEPFPVGIWKRVTIFVHADMDAGANGTDGIAEVSVDSIPAASAPIPTAFRAGATSVNVTLGAVFGDGPIGPFRSNLDNVRIYTLE
jgi:hypothetical protein